MEAIDPIVRAILDDIVIREDGAAYIDHYADWVMHLRTLRAIKASRVFVQLSILAGQYLEADCKPVAVSLAVLARIGLPDPKQPFAPPAPVMSESV